MLLELMSLGRRERGEEKICEKLDNTNRNIGCILDDLLNGFSISTLPALFPWRATRGPLICPLPNISVLLCLFSSSILTGDNNPQAY